LIIDNIVNHYYFFIILLLLPVSAVAQSSPWEIEADTVSSSRDPERVEASGNVVLKRQSPGGNEETADGVVVNADSLQYEPGTGSLTVSGLTLHKGADIIEADEGYLDLNLAIGVLKGAKVYYSDKGIHFKGEELSRKGERTFLLKNSWVTTCEPPAGETPPWRIRASEVEFTVEGYAFLSHASLWIKQVPVFYTPFLIFPVKKNRATGFLYPEFSQSQRDGIGLVTPFFLDISPSSDLTLYPGYYSKRGSVHGIEYRHVASFKTRWAVAYTYLDDRTRDSIGEDYKSDGFLRTNNNRWWLRSKAEHELGSLTARMDIDLVSDRDYLPEFREGVIGFDHSNHEFFTSFNRGFQEETIPFRESSLQLGQGFGSAFLGGELRFVDDLASENNESSVQTLPRILFDYNAVYKNLLAFDFNSEYVYFRREKGVSQHRVDFFPRLIAPIPFFENLEGTLSGGVRETVYQVETHGAEYQQAWVYKKYQDRTAWDFQSKITTTLVRDFSLDFWSYQWLEHTLRPEINYHYLSNVSQDKLPEFDSEDRILARDWITIVLNNYFNLGGYDQSLTALNRHVGSLKISQTGDLQNEQLKPLSDILLKLELLPFYKFNLTYETTLSVYGQGVNRYNLVTRYIEKNKSLTLDYRYNRYPGVAAPYFYYENADVGALHELNLAAQTILTNNFSLKGDITRSLATDRSVGESIRLIYHPPCWSMDLSLTNTPDDQKISITFSLTGIGNIFGLSLASDRALNTDVLL
jgi:LPS-assembly protein